ncbi:hypothetical protein AOLI_G00013940 [Acnodon oligacanthus]
MPKAKRNVTDLSDMEDANAQSGASAPCLGSTATGELTTALLKDVLIATIRDDSTLRAEFIAELRSSHASLTTNITSLNSKVRDIETAATDVDKRIAELETMCKTMDSENRRLREKMDNLENRCLYDVGSRLFRKSSYLGWIPCAILPYPDIVASLKFWRFPGSLIEVTVALC